MEDYVLDTDQILPNTFILSLDEAATVQINNEAETWVTGQIILFRPSSEEGDEEIPELETELLTSGLFELKRFALNIESVNLNEGQTGAMSLIAHTNAAAFTVQNNGEEYVAALDIPLRCFLTYEALPGANSDEDSDFYAPHHLMMDGTLILEISRDAALGDENVPPDAWRIIDMRITLNQLFDELELAIPVQNILILFGGGIQLLAYNLTNFYPPSSQEGYPSELRVRPVWVTETAAASIPTSFRDYIRAQMEQAVRFWERAQINIVIEYENQATETYYRISNNAFLAKGMVAYRVTTASETVASIATKFAVTAAQLVEYNINLSVGGSVLRDGIVAVPSLNVAVANSVLADEGVWTRALQSWTRNSGSSPFTPQAGIIDIFFVNYHEAVNTALQLGGGGITYGSNTSYAKVMVSDRRLPPRDGTQPALKRWMDFLVAHELGHVMGLKHPASSTLVSDGNLNIPRMTVKAFRWDTAVDNIPTTDNSCDCAMRGTPSASDNLNKVRMGNILCHFEDFWKSAADRRDFAPPNDANYVDELPTAAILNTIRLKTPGIRFPIDKSDPNYQTDLQQSLDSFVNGVTAGEIGSMQSNPVLILFIDETATPGTFNPDAYHMGISAGTGTNRKAFAVPIIVFNKATRGWASAFTCPCETPYPAAPDPCSQVSCQQYIAFRTELYEFLKAPRMYAPGVGTIMHAQTPDPYVLDDDMAQAINEGIYGASPLIKLNPALRVTALPPVAAPYRPDSVLGLYIPSVRGDIGRSDREELGNVYSSPYVWNRRTYYLGNASPPNDTALEKAALKTLRETFFIPTNTPPTHYSPTRFQLDAMTQLLNITYVHVRMRANRLRQEIEATGVTLTAANMTTEVTNWLQNNVRLYVGVKHPGFGWSRILGVGTNSYDMCGTNNLNSGRATLVEWIEEAVNPTVGTNPSSYHPFYAGLTFRIEWFVPPCLDPHSCIVAFVVSNEQPLMDDKNVVLISWAQASSATWRFGDATNLGASANHLVRHNAQFIQRNIEIVEMAGASILALVAGFKNMHIFPLPPISMVYRLEENQELNYRFMAPQQAVHPQIEARVIFGEASGTILHPNQEPLIISSGVQSDAGLVQAFSLRLSVPDDFVLTNNEDYILNIEPWVNDEFHIDGYSFALRYAEIETVIDIFRDRVLGAIDAYAQGFGSEYASVMLTNWFGHFSQINYSEEDLLEWIKSETTEAEVSELLEDIKQRSEWVSILALDTLFANYQANRNNDGLVFIEFKDFFHRLQYLATINSGILGNLNLPASKPTM